MTLPASLTLIPVHGQILKADSSGTPASGSVSFRVEHTLRDTTDNVLLTPTTITATLDATGSFTVSLPATDDPDVSPQGWTYVVTIATDALRDSFRISIPATTVGTLEFADIAPAVSPSALVTYALASDVLPKSGGAIAGDLSIAGRLSVDGWALPFVHRGRNAPYRDPARLVTNFQAGHGWTTSGSVDASSNLNDTADFVRGTQAAKVVFTGNGNLDVSGLSALDLTGKALRFLVKVDDVTKLSQLNIRVGTSSSNVFQWQTAATNGTNTLYTSGEWTTVTVGWADVHSAAGTYSLDSHRTPSATSGFTFVRFQVVATGGNCTVHFQALEIVDNVSATFPSGVCSIVFDDSWDGQYTLARPKMDTYGFRGTAYTIAQSIDTAGRMTSTQLRTLQDYSGWEIAGHAYTQTVHDNRLTSYTAAQVDDELRNLRAWMVTNGFGGDSYAYPGGNFGRTTDGYPIERITSRYFSSGRTILATYGSAANVLKEQWPPPRPYRMLALSAIGDYPGTGGMDDPTQIVADGGVLDVTQRSGSWLILTFHAITAGTGTQDTECSQAAFATIVDAIASKNIPVRPVGDVTRYFG